MRKLYRLSCVAVKKTMLAGGGRLRREVAEQFRAVVKQTEIAITVRAIFFMCPPK
jgi:hypothetical protein